MTSIKYKERYYEVNNGVLNLNELGIKNIAEIKGLEMLSDLKELFLNKNNINEIKGLENLKNLERLFLGLNLITEIKGLDNLTNLKKLFLGGNKINEIKGFENLRNLEQLTLGNNLITEIKGLDNLTNLKKLELSFNSIIEIKGLETLKKLNVLYLGYNKINQIKGLETLKKLNVLNLGVNRINQIKGLETLANLEKLILWSNNITEIKGLETLKKLNVLNLNGNKINQIKGLETLSNLEKLGIRGKRIPQAIIEQLGGLDRRGWANNSQKFVEYCRQKRQQIKKVGEKRGRKEREEKERKRLERMQREKLEARPLERIENKAFSISRSHNYIAYSFIFINIERKEDYNIDWLKKTLKKLVIKEGEEVKTTSFSGDYFDFQVEYVIDPIINIFEDYKNRNCMSINIGFSIEFSFGFHKQEKDSEQKIRILNKLLKDLLFIPYEYKGQFYAFGGCNNNSYVQKERFEKKGFIMSFVMGNDPNLNKYEWFFPNYQKIDSTIIYSMFPKKYITLTTDEKFDIKLNPLKVMEFLRKKKENSNDSKDEFR